MIRNSYSWSLLGVVGFRQGASAVVLPSDWTALFFRERIQAFEERSKPNFPTGSQLGPINSPHTVFETYVVVSAPNPDFYNLLRLLLYPTSLNCAKVFPSFIVQFHAWPCGALSKEPSRLGPSG